MSCSIVELPPDVQNRRQNNIILSLWIAKEQPDINLWLDRCFSQLAHLKIAAKSTIKKRDKFDIFRKIVSTAENIIILLHNPVKNVC